MESTQLQAIELRTYQNRSTDKHQVPYHVFLAGEARVSDLQHAQVPVEEVCVKQDAHLWTRDEEAGQDAPYLRWEPPDVEWMEEELVGRQEPQCGADGGSEDSGSKIPIPVLDDVRILGSTMGWNGLPRNRRRLPVGVHRVVHGQKEMAISQARLTMQTF